MGPISCMVCSNFMSIKELIKQFHTMSITSSFSTPHPTPQQDIHVNLYSSRITVTVVCTRRRTFFFKFCEIFLFVWPCISFGIDLLPFGSILLTCISGLLFYYYALIISRRMVIGGFFTKEFWYITTFFKLPLTNLRQNTHSWSSRSLNNTV